MGENVCINKTYFTHTCYIGREYVGRLAVVERATAETIEWVPRRAIESCGRPTPLPGLVQQRGILGQSALNAIANANAIGNANTT